MTQQKPNQILKQDWYIQFIEETKAMIVEGEFASRWTLIETYHRLGTAILEMKANFDRKELYGQRLVSTIAESLDRGNTTVKNAIRFAEKFPDISKIPNGKNISWSKIVREHLNTPNLCNHSEAKPVMIEIWQCPDCGKKWHNEEEFKKHQEK